MGVTNDPDEIVFGPRGSNPVVWPPAAVKVVPPDVKPRLLPDMEKHHKEMRLDKLKRANYWKGISWLDILGDRILDFVEQPNTLPGCPAFAVAIALRANLAIHRRTYPEPKARQFPITARDGHDPGPLDPWFLLLPALRRAQTYSPKASDLLEASLSIADLYGTPKAGEGLPPVDKLPDPPPVVTIDDGLISKAAPHKIQGFQELGTFLGQYSAWVHVWGPIVVQMNIERAAFVKVNKAHQLLEYQPGIHKQDTDKSDAYASHVMVVAGYNNNEHPSFPDTFTLINTNRQWGDNGVGYIKVETARKCFIAGYGLKLREHEHYSYDGKLSLLGYLKLLLLRWRQKS